MQSDGGRPTIATIMFSGARPSRAAVLLLVSGMTWIGLASGRIITYMTEDYHKPQPILTIVLTGLGIWVAVSAAAVVCQYYIRLLLALLRDVRAEVRAAESDRDRIVARVHDRIDRTAVGAKTDLDRSVRWLLRRLDS